MERAGRLIAKWRHSGNCVTPEDLLRAAWPRAVGKHIAAHTACLKLVRTHLVVEVQDDIWQRQLFALRGQILKNLEKAVGEGIVNEVEFRMPKPGAIPRIGPGREESLRQAPPRKSAASDEADRVDDPVLRHIYRAARKRASA